MYTIERREGKIFIVDADGRPVYASSEDGYIVYKAEVMGKEVVSASKVKDMRDEQLLIAVATAIKLKY